eukprot:jgi/Mesvir1/23190/Mv22656-RA.2
MAPKSDGLWRLLVAKRAGEQRACRLRRTAWLAWREAVDAKPAPTSAAAAMPARKRGMPPPTQGNKRGHGATHGERVVTDARTPRTILAPSTPPRPVDRSSAPGANRVVTDDSSTASSSSSSSSSRRSDADFFRATGWSSDDDNGWVARLSPLVTSTRQRGWHHAPRVPVTNKSSPTPLGATLSGGMSSTTPGAPSSAPTISASLPLRSPDTSGSLSATWRAAGLQVPDDTTSDDTSVPQARGAKGKDMGGRGARMDKQGARARLGSDSVGVHTGLGVEASAAGTGMHASSSTSTDGACSRCHPHSSPCCHHHRCHHHHCHHHRKHERCGHAVAATAFKRHGSSPLQSSPLHRRSQHSPSWVGGRPGGISIAGVAAAAAAGGGGGVGGSSSYEPRGAPRARTRSTQTTPLVHTGSSGGGSGQQSVTQATSDLTSSTSSLHESAPAPQMHDTAAVPARGAHAAHRGVVPLPMSTAEAVHSRLSSRTPWSGRLHGRRYHHPAPQVVSGRKSAKVVPCLKVGMRGRARGDMRAPLVYVVWPGQHEGTRGVHHSIQRVPSKRDAATSSADVARGRPIKGHLSRKGQSKMSQASRRDWGLRSLSSTSDEEPADAPSARNSCRVGRPAANKPAAAGPCSVAMLASSTSSLSSSDGSSRRQTLGAREETSDSAGAVTRMHAPNTAGIRHALGADAGMNQRPPIAEVPTRRQLLPMLTTAMSNAARRKAPNQVPADRGNAAAQRGKGSVRHDDGWGGRATARPWASLARRALLRRLLLRWAAWLASVQRARVHLLLASAFRSIELTSRALFCLLRHCLAAIQARVASHQRAVSLLRRCLRAWRGATWTKLVGPQRQAMGSQLQSAAAVLGKGGAADIRHAWVAATGLSAALPARFGTGAHVHPAVDWAAVDRAGSDRADYDVGDGDGDGGGSDYDLGHGKDDYDDGDGDGDGGGSDYDLGHGKDDYDAGDGDGDGGGSDYDLGHGKDDYDDGDGDGAEHVGDDGGGYNFGDGDGEIRQDNGFDEGGKRLTRSQPRAWDAVPRVAPRWQVAADAEADAEATMMMRMMSLWTPGVMPSRPHTKGTQGLPRNATAHPTLAARLPPLSMPVSPSLTAPPSLSTSRKSPHASTIGAHASTPAAHAPSLRRQADALCRRHLLLRCYAAWEGYVQRRAAKRHVQGEAARYLRECQQRRLLLAWAGVWYYRERRRKAARLFRSLVRVRLLVAWRDVAAERATLDAMWHFHEAQVRRAVFCGWRGAQAADIARAASFCRTSCLARSWATWLEGYHNGSLSLDDGLGGERDRAPVQTTMAPFGGSAHTLFVSLNADVNRGQEGAPSTRHVPEGGAERACQVDHEGGGALPHRGEGEGGYQAGRGGEQEDVDGAGNAGEEAMEAGGEHARASMLRLPERHPDSDDMEGAELEHRYDDEKGCYRTSIEDMPGGWSARWGTPPYTDDVPHRTSMDCASDWGEGDSCDGSVAAEGSVASDSWEQQPLMMVADMRWRLMTMACALDQWGRWMLRHQQKRGVVEGEEPEEDSGAESTSTVGERE